MPDQNWTFVSAAFGVTWATILLYWLHAERELRRARRAYEQATPARSGGAP